MLLMRFLNQTFLNFVRVFLLGVAGFSAVAAPDSMTNNVTISGTNTTLILHRYSIRSPDFKLFLWSSGGGYVPATAPEITTYRGTVVGQPNLIVCGSLRGNNLYAIATEGKNNAWSIGPVDVSAQIAGLADTDWIAPQPVATNTHTQAHLPAGMTNLPWNFIKPTAIKQAELGYDVSWNFFRSQGSSVQSLCDWVDDLVNRYNNFMARDGAIDILLTTMVIRTDAELYVPTSGGQHLNLIYNEWKSGSSTGDTLLSTQRWDMVASFGTDSGLFGTGGYAWGNNIGKDEASTCVNALFHENGHNWNCNHYFYGNDTMNGSHPSHGAINVQRVLTKRITEITEANLDDVTTYPEPLHPYTTIDLASSLTNTPVDIDVLTNDWDSKGLSIAISGFTAASGKGGTVTQVGNKLRYTPPLNYVGKDIVAYWITNSAGLENRDLIHIEVSNNDLAARWDFEGTNGTSVVDITGNTHNGTLSGTTLVPNAPPGPVGRAIDLNGGTMICDNSTVLPVAATGYPFETAANNYFDPMDRSFTLAFWFKPTDLSGASYLLKKSNPASLGYELTADSSGFHFNIVEWGADMTTHTLNSGTALTAGSWYHVACQIDRGANVLRMWVNGTPIAGTSAISPGAHVFEGRYDLVLGDTNARIFDDVRIYTRALNNAEIGAIYAIGTPPAGQPSPANDAGNLPVVTQLSWLSNSSSNQHDVYFGTDAAAVAAATTNLPLYKGRISPMTFNPGLLGSHVTYYWRVDVVPPAGPLVPGDVWHFTTADSPLTANLIVHLTLDNADVSVATVQDIAPTADNFNNTSALTGQPGIIGQSFYFNGTNSSVLSASLNPVGQVGAATLSLWMNTTSTATAFLFNAEGAWCISYANGTLVSFMDGSQAGSPTVSSNLNNGAWHHIAVANNGTTSTVYVDGAQVATYAETLYNLNLQSRNIAVGSIYDGTGDRFTGSIDDVGIWARGLTAGEVSQIYSNGLAGRSLEREVQLAGTSFESAEGFTGYVSPNFAALNTKTNIADGSIWSGLGGDVQIWNRSDIPPNGVQCLKLGDADGQCRVRFPGTNHGVGTVSFDFASYSTTAATAFSLSYSNAASGGWIEVWSANLAGNNPPWEAKPWPTVSIPINAVGDVDLLLKEVGTKGVLVDNFLVTTKSNFPPVFAANPLAKSGATAGVAYTNSIALDVYDPAVTPALTFAKLGGPAWLSVTANGALAGTPTGADYGANNFTVRVTNANGQTGDAILTINVAVNAATLLAGTVPNPSYTKFWSWLAADNSSSPNGVGADANAAIVTRWDDVRGAFDHDLARNSGGGGGIFYTNRVNGLPAINYTGTRNNWGAFSTAGEFQTMTNGYTLFLVARVNAPLPATGYLFDGSSGNGRVALRVASGSPAKWQLQAVRTAAPALNVSTNTANVTTNALQVHAVQVSGTNMTHWINGALAGSGSFADGSTPLPMSGLILSCDAAVANHLECDVTEVLAYNEVFSAGNRNALENYLLSKYALVLPPPNAPVITPSLSGGNLLMPVNSQSGYTYVLQSATNLVSPVSWTGVTTNAGTGGVLNFSAPVNPVQPQSYFRVVAY